MSKITRLLLRHFKSEEQTMMWSSISMPMISPARYKRWVRSISSLLGDTSPNGWLCARMMLAAACDTADQNTSRFCTMDAERLPMETVSLWMDLFSGLEIETNEMLFVFILYFCQEQYGVCRIRDYRHHRLPHLQLPCGRVQERRPGHKLWHCRSPSFATATITPVTISSSH